MMPLEHFQSCMAACRACAAACEHCAASCLREEDVRSMVRCIRLDLDCEQACLVAASLMARHSPFSKDFCRLCAEVCDACAEECAQHAMEHCQRCAQACRDCAQACRHMIAQDAAATSVGGA